MFQSKMRARHSFAKIMQDFMVLIFSRGLWSYFMFKCIKGAQRRHKIYRRADGGGRNVVGFLKIERVA